MSALKCFTNVCSHLPLPDIHPLRPLFLPLRVGMRHSHLKPQSACILKHPTLTFTRVRYAAGIFASMILMSMFQQVGGAAALQPQFCDSFVISTIISKPSFVAFASSLL